MSSKRQLTKHKVDHLGFNTDAEKIIGYLDGSLPKESLNRKLVEKLDRIVQAKAWLLEHKFQTKVVEMLMNHYQYSEVTAYRDLRLMERVFGPEHPTTVASRNNLAKIYRALAKYLDADALFEHN